MSSTQFNTLLILHALSDVRPMSSSSRVYTGAHKKSPDISENTEHDHSLKRKTSAQSSDGQHTYLIELNGEHWTCFDSQIIIYEMRCWLSCSDEENDSLEMRNSMYRELFGDNHISINHFSLLLPFLPSSSWANVYLPLQENFSTR